MRSTYEQTRASPPVPVRDPLAEDVIGAAASSSASDVYPIRQAWTFVIPPMRAEQSAHQER